ncbi:MAG: nucleotidyltransferase family protein [Candidatus Desulfovibrio faecigallinarum]|nr:nucleotidyltransferase family protein [Candidatus Desulfovibrio faecigallinarum]
MRNTHVAVLVLAAGFSTRMKAFKPLLPLGSDRTILARVAGLWKICGVKDIVVVSGHRAHDVEKEAESLGCLIVRNPRPEEGMFSSVQTGLNFCLQRLFHVDWLAVHPVDIPLIAQGTLEILCERARTSAAPCLVPVFDGQGGHPPLLGRRVWGSIAAYTGDGGLKQAMQGLAREDVPVEDSYLDTDLDRPEDYERAKVLLQGSACGD